MQNMADRARQTTRLKHHGYFLITSGCKVTSAVAICICAVATCVCAVTTCVCAVTTCVCAVGICVCAVATCVCAVGICLCRGDLCLCRGNLCLCRAICLCRGTCGLPYILAALDDFIVFFRCVLVYGRNNETKRRNSGTMKSERVSPRVKVTSLFRRLAFW